MTAGAADLVRLLIEADTRGLNVSDVRRRLRLDQAAARQLMERAVAAGHAVAYDGRLYSTAPWP